MIQTGQDASQFALIAPFLVGSAVVLLYVGMMYYVEFSESAVHQAKYFGLGDTNFNLTSVTQVSLRATTNAFMMRVAAIRIRAGTREIGLQTNLYPRDGLIKLVTALKEAGAPVDVEVLRELKLDVQSTIGPKDA